MRKVLVTDDHPLFRVAIKEAVKKALPDALISEAGGAGRSGSVSGQ